MEGASNNPPDAPGYPVNLQLLSLTLHLWVKVVVDMDDALFFIKKRKNYSTRLAMKHFLKKEKVFTHPQ